MKTILPQIDIQEDQFDFGKITTFNNSGTLKMTITNKSSISAELVLDLRTDEENPDAPDGIDCLKVRSLDDSNNP